MLGIAALGRFAGMAVVAAVGAGMTFAAQLFLTVVTLVAFLATVDHAADGHVVADLVARHL